MPLDPQALRTTLDRLSREQPQDDAGTHAALQHAVDACARLFHVSGSGIMLADEQSMLSYVASSDEPGRDLELAESNSGEGPCTTAFVYQHTVDTRDTHADDEHQPQQRSQAELKMKPTADRRSGVHDSTSER